MYIHTCVCVYNWDGSGILKDLFPSLSCVVGILDIMLAGVFIELEYDLEDCNANQSCMLWLSCDI